MEKLSEKNEIKIYCLESLKGFGAFVIAFIWHYQHFRPQEGMPFYSMFSKLYDYGYLMVECFFILSGFGMLLGYEKKIIKENIGFSEYICKRIKKLYPPMITTLLVTTGLEYVYVRRAGHPFQYPNYDVYHFILNLLGLQNGILETKWSFNSPSWCISILISCYIVFYLAVYYSRKSKGEFLVLGYVLLALLGCVTILSRTETLIINNMTGRGLSCFFIGVILGKVYEYKAKFHEKKIGYICLCLFIAFILTALRFGYESWGDVQMVMILGIFPLAILSVLFLPWLKRLLELKPFIWLGNRSLSIYLWHFPVQCVFQIVNVYGDFNFNYSLKFLWFLYIFIVIIVAAIYDYTCLNMTIKLKDKLKVIV